MFNSVPSNGLSVRSEGGEAPAEPLTIHTPGQAHGQRDTAIQEAISSTLGSIGPQQLQQGAPERIHAKPLSANPVQSCIEPPASEFIKSFPSIGIALSRAVEHGYMKIVNGILEQGVNKKDMDSALISAAYKENEEVVNALFKAGADKWLANTVLVQAALKKNIKMMNIAFGVGVDQEYIDKAFVEAVVVKKDIFTKRQSIEEIEKAQIDMVNIFLRTGVSEEYIGKALVKAAKTNNLKTVNILLEAGVSKEYVGKAFVKAVRMGSELEKTLIDMKKKWFINNNDNDNYNTYNDYRNDCLNNKKQNREILNNLLKVFKSQPGLDHYVGEALAVAKTTTKDGEMAQFILDAGYRDNMFVVSQALQTSEEQEDAEFMKHVFSNVLKEVFLSPLPPVKDS